MLVHLRWTLTKFGENRYSKNENEAWVTFQIDKPEKKKKTSIVIGNQQYWLM